MTQEISHHAEAKNMQNDIESLGLVKQLFLGRIDPQKLFPYPRPSLEEKERTDLFCHKLRQFCESHIDPHLIDKQSIIPQEVIEGLAKHGMLGLSVPQNFGGVGMSFTAYCKALEVVSQRCGSTSAFITAHQSIGFKALLLYGTPEQKNRWLPLIAKGEAIAAFALTEENAGSDANGVETKAVYDPQKNVFYLTGKKQWITNGSFAKVLTVMAKTEMDTPKGKQQRVTAFIVTPDMPGFKITHAALDKVGLRGIQSTSLDFDHMEVPAENMLGKLGEGLKVALSVLNYGRTSIGAGCVGPAKILCDDAFKYAIERRQFDQPLSSFALVKQKLTMLAALTYAMDAVTYFTAGKIDGGEKDFMIEAAIVKVFSTESLWKMLFDTMQIFGGKSMFTDKPYEMMMRDCRPGMIVEGSNEVMHLFIAMTGIKEVSKRLEEYKDAFKNPFAAGEKIQSSLQYLRRLYWPSNVEVYSPLIQKEAKFLSKKVAQFGRSIIRLILKYGEKLIDRQQDLERISQAAINLYTTCAVLSKLDSELDRVHGKVELLGRDIETGQFYCHYALKNVEKILASLFDPQDKASSILADHLLEDL